MPPSELKLLIETLDDMLGEASMPEIVAALIWLSKGYKEQMISDNNSEYQGWVTWEDNLSDMLKAIVGQEEFDELVLDK